MFRTAIITLLLALVALTSLNLFESRDKCVTEEQLEPVIGKIYGALNVFADSIQDLQKKKGAK